jgi:hypothetical protein
VFIDHEEMLVGYLQPISPGNVSAEMPNDPDLPFVLVTRLSGGDDRITEFAIMEISVFHNSRSSASSSARSMHSMMLNLKPSTLGLAAGGVPVRIDRVSTIHGPSWMDYRDENLRQYTARYVIESRVHSQNS